MKRFHAFVGFSLALPLMSGCLSRAHAQPATVVDPVGLAKRRPDSLHAHQSEWPGTCAVVRTPGHETRSRQSPIALSDVNFGGEDVKALRIGGGQLQGDLVDTGHTFQVRFAHAPQSVEFEGLRYNVKQLHFHKPAEHIINGRQLDMEMHIVFVRDDAGPTDPRKIFVAGFPIARGRANTALGGVWHHLPPLREGYGEESAALVDWRLFSRHSEIDTARVHAGETVLKTAVDMDFDKLLPPKAPLYVYEGSLTTPGCDENVTFAISTTPLEMSDDQLERFEGYYEGNNRDPQALGNVAARRFRKALYTQEKR